MKAFLTLFTLTLLSFSANAQIPANDDCAGLVNLGEAPYCSAAGQFTNLNATTSVVDVPGANVPACFNNSAERDVWFQFTLPSDGSVVDIEISVFGDVGGNGTMKMPQVALYRGDCTFGNLDELACAAAPLNVNEVRLQQLGLSTGIPYFLRINDYSATGTPNAGTFKLCIQPYVADFNIGDVAGTSSCSGTLWDSGGPNGDYSSSENLTFTICPQDFHQCILVNVENYQLEQGYDFLHFYQGDDVSDVKLTQLTGLGNSFQVQVAGPCATIGFTSDGSLTDAGFKITWTCSPNACTTPPPTTCSDPDVIAGLPFAANNLSTCFSGNSVNDGPCNDEIFLSGNDYIFTYTSPGDECINVATTGTGLGAGVGVYDQCPSLPGANCITSAGGGFASINPTVNAAFLENPGTYYIVFGAGLDCSPFNIAVNTVTCPVVVPSASTCDDALDIGGCSNTLPEIITLTPGAGDPNFIQQGVNQGCFVLPQFNYSFFYFKAGADGKFGFTVQAADPTLDGEDIDFNVWGPIDDAADICDFVSNNQPVRSSWTGTALPSGTGLPLTGMADLHPTLFTPVSDDFDCDNPSTPGADGDAFVRRLDVEAGKFYVVMLDDFSNVITDSGISIDFSGTTAGVLNALGDEITVSSDTAVCAGQPVQLNATGGAAYFWSPSNSLSCTNCPNPIATPTQSTSYEVQIVTACDVVTRVVNVKTIELDLGPDVTYCNNATFTLNANGYQDAVYVWTGPPGLSCDDCPSPEVSGLTTGVYTFTATMTTPQCSETDAITVTIIPGQQPQYNIADDKIICQGQTVFIGGTQVPNILYSWLVGNNPTPFSTLSNPSVTPSVTTTYYLLALDPNSTCPIPSFDSIKVEVVPRPLLDMQGDTAICNGESVQLAYHQSQPGVNYSWTWSPSVGSPLDDPNSATPIATPQGFPSAVTPYTFTLTATISACTVVVNVPVDVVDFNLNLNVTDTAICKGSPVTVNATLTPPPPGGGMVTWQPTTGLQIAPNGLSAIALPNKPSLYVATAAVPGCIRMDTLNIHVDSLPPYLTILPIDTMICKGAMVELTTNPLPDLGSFPIPPLEFLWTPADGQLTPDSLINMVVQPDTTTVYYRKTTNGVCMRTDSALVKVIPPAQMFIVPADTTICPGQSVQLQLIPVTPGITGIMWSPPDGLSCFEECYNPVATPGGSMTYMAEGEFMGCPVNATTNINVSPLPSIQMTGQTELCEGASVTLNTAYDPLSNYVWASTDPNFQPSQNPTVTPTLSMTTYSVTATNAIGCTNVGSVTIRVNPQPSLTVDGDTTICLNFSTQLTASGSVPGTYIWNTGQTGQNITVTPSSMTVYTVTYTPNNSVCPPIIGSVTVNVSGVGPQVTPQSDLELCPGSQVILNTIPPPSPATTYTWTSIPPGFNFNQAIPPPQTPDTTTEYLVTAINGQCTLMQTIKVVVYSATLTLPDEVRVCAGESVNITANGSLTGTYLWSTGQTTSTITVSPTQTTTYTVEYIYGDSCLLDGAVDVIVLPSFMLTIEAEPDTNRINIGETVELTGIVSPSQNLTNFQFAWTENGQQSVGNTESVTLTPEGNETSVAYTLVATSPNGCSQEARIEFELVQPKVVVPNAFTPNNDGVNDVFRLKVLEGTIRMLQMDVYNRWGEKVFSSNEPDAAWDGKMSDGKGAPSDVYVYYIRWERGDGALQPPFKGDVALLR